jgi:hypothetical protein
MTARGQIDMFKKLSVSAAIILFILFLFFQFYQVKTGVIASPNVTGLFYQTSSGLSGLTDNGNYTYKNGDTVNFYLGASNKKFLIGTITAQPQIELTLLSSSPRRNINLISLLVLLDETPDNHKLIKLHQEIIGNNNFLDKVRRIDFQSLLNDFEFLESKWPTLARTSLYLSNDEQPKDSFATEEILLNPLNRKMKSIYIQIRNYQGELCFYDVSKRNTDNYFGPIGSITYKVSTDGIFEYPDIGDYFYGCSLKAAEYNDQISFSEISNFEKFQGVVGCAAQGCKRSDLTGFYIDEYQDGEDYKYRSVALSFDTKTKLLNKKVQGLGKTKDILDKNRGERIEFTIPVNNYKLINFNGIWLESMYLESGLVEYKCIKITKNNIATALATKANCNVPADNYSVVDDGSFGDMWWLSSSDKKATLEQLNTPVKWTDAYGKENFTSWEFLPAGNDWQSGLLFRFKQEMTFDDNGNQKLTTTKLSELQKL